MKLLMFTTSVEHTTFRKTARMLSKEGVKTVLYGFTRKNYPKSKDDLEQIVLGSMEHGSYLKRIYILLTTILPLRKKISEFQILHVFTLDTLIIAKLATIFKKKIIIYQVQDIRKSIAGSGLYAKILRIIEGALLKSVHILVLSSPEYYYKYFKKYYGTQIEKVIVIENKLEFKPVPTFNDERDSLEITIGYFGVLRCTRSFKILKKIVENSTGNTSLYFRGKPVALSSIEEYIGDNKNIEYGGLYRSPDDLTKIYSNVDIVWAAYPYSNQENGNWTMARTIRFYEACAYNKPVIVQHGTPHAKVVEENKIGLVVDMSDVEKATSDVMSITSDIIQVWEENLKRLDNNIYLHSDEFKKFKKMISKKINE